MGMQPILGGNKCSGNSCDERMVGKKSGMGTMPHALIQMFGGDVVEATKSLLSTISRG
ncbi:hypothetical protein GCM10020331_031220 [Ectobacillus funiculus]